MKRVNFKSKKTIVLTIAVIALVVGLSYVAYAQFIKDDQSNTDDVTTTGISTNLGPPTEQEKQETEAHKDELIKQAQNEKNEQQTSAKKQASVIITGASSSSANAYVSGVVEDGGTCTFTFTRGGDSVTRTTKGFANVSVTNCEPVTPNLPSGGDWMLIVSYSSTKAEGKSQVTTFKVV